jgi:hypothetical protein
MLIGQFQHLADMAQQQELRQQLLMQRQSPSPRQDHRQDRLGPNEQSTRLTAQHFVEDTLVAESLSLTTRIQGVTARIWRELSQVTLPPLARVRLVDGATRAAHREVEGYGVNVEEIESSEDSIVLFLDCLARTLRSHIVKTVNSMHDHGLTAVTELRAPAGESYRFTPSHSRHPSQNQSGVDSIGRASSARLPMLTTQASPRDRGQMGTGGQSQPSVVLPLVTPTKSVSFAPPASPATQVSTAALHHIEEAVARLVVPHAADKTEAQYRRRVEAYQCLQSTLLDEAQQLRIAEQSTIESATTGANAPSSVPSGHGPVKTIGSVQIPDWVFKNKHDRIAYSRMRESEITATGRSAIPDMGIAFTPSWMAIDLWGNGIGPIPDQYPGLNLNLNPFFTAPIPTSTTHTTQVPTHHRWGQIDPNSHLTAQTPTTIKRSQSAPMHSLFSKGLTGERFNSSDDGRWRPTGVGGVGGDNGLPPGPTAGGGASAFRDDEHRHKPRSEIDEAIAMYSFPHSPQQPKLLVDREFTPGILSANESFRLEMERRLR